MEKIPKNPLSSILSVIQDLVIGAGSEALSTEALNLLSKTTLEMVITTLALYVSGIRSIVLYLFPVLALLSASVVFIVVKNRRRLNARPLERIESEDAPSSPKFSRESTISLEIHVYVHSDDPQNLIPPADTPNLERKDS